MKYIPFVSLCLLLAFISPLPAEDVEVFAAASLTDVLKALAAMYEKSGNDKIVFNFAASNLLAIQIKTGAPADIFFSADEVKMDDLAKADLILADTRLDLLSNTLTIVTPLVGKTTIHSASDLTNSKLRKIALGQPQSVPAGIYAKEYLTKIGLWDKISDRVVPCENVRAALAAVETGNADAAIVYKTDALHSQKIKIACEIPVAEGPAIAYPIALVKPAKHLIAAKKFLEYLKEPSSLKVFEKYGFITKG